MAVPFLDVIPIHIQYPYFSYLTSLFQCYVCFNVFAATKNQNKLSLPFFLCASARIRVVGSPFTRPRTFKHITLGMTPLDEWSARRRDQYLTTHNSHKRQTSMPSVGFEPTAPARPSGHGDRQMTFTITILTVKQSRKLQRLNMQTLNYTHSKCRQS